MLRNNHLDYAIVLTCLMATLCFAQPAQWQVFTYGKDVTSLASFGDTLWAGTESGVVMISKKTGKTTFYEHNNTNVPLRFVSTLVVRSSGMVGAGTVYNGCYYLEDNGWTQRGGYWQVQALAVDRHDNVWVGSSDVRLSRQRRAGNTVWADDFDIRECGRPATNVTSLAFDKEGILWVGLGRGTSYDGGVAKFDGAHWTVFDSQNSPLPPSPVYSITVARNGDVWLAFLFGGLAKYSNGSWTIYNKSNSPLPSDNVYTVAADSLDRVWIGMWTDGLVCFDGATWKRYTASNSGLPSNYVESLLPEKDGDVWIGTMRGLVRFDGTLWQSFETSSSALPGPYMNAIADDREGNVWISCHSDWYDQGGGLVKVTGSVWKIFDRTSAPYAVTDISDMKFDWDNVLWATSFYCGLLRFDGSRWTNFTPSNSKLPQAHLRCLSLDIRGRVWIGTYGNGIVQFDGRTWTTYDLVSRGAASNDVRSIEAGRSDGMVWIGTTCGLVKFDASGRLSVFNSKNTPLPHDTINVIRFDNKGVLWVGTEGAIASYDGRSWRVVRLPQGDGWWSDVTDIRFEPSGLIWVGTRGEGLLSYNGFGWTHFDYRTSPFPGDMVYTITIDKNQNKWIGSWNGMAIYRSWGVQVSVDTSRTTRLLHPFPSPFNDATRIVFSVAQPAHAQLNVFNLLGQKVKTLVNGELLAGQHALLWDGTNESGERVATGAYFCRLQIGDFSAVKRVVMVR